MSQKMDRACGCLSSDGLRILLRVDSWNLCVGCSIQCLRLAGRGGKNCGSREGGESLLVLWCLIWYVVYLEGAASIPKDAPAESRVTYHCTYTRYV